MSCCDVKHSKQPSKAITQEMSYDVYFERFLCFWYMNGFWKGDKVGTVGLF